MDSAESGASDAYDSVRGDRQPRRAGIRGRIRGRIEIRIKARTNVRSGDRSFSDRGAERRLDSVGGAKVALNGGIPSGRAVRQSGRRQSGVHHSAGHKSGRRKQVAKNASSPSEAKAQISETTKLRSFASPAARVLRSVGSRWQTGWRSAMRACGSTVNDHPLSNLYHGRRGLSSASRSPDSNQPDAAP